MLCPRMVRLVCLFVVWGCAPAEDYAPEISGAAPMVLETDALFASFPQEATSTNRAFTDLPGSRLACASIPTQSEINSAEMTYQDYYMSAKRAASLNIPIVNASGDADYLVVIRDYRRFKPCMASDNRTTLHYGQVLRAVVELTQYNATGRLALASIAADATLSGKQQYFYLYRTGMYNPRVDSIIQQVSGKVFDVENYALYQSVMPQLIGLMSARGTTLSPQIIMRVPDGDDPGFTMASARAYALSQAKDGRSCQEARRRFAQDPARATAVVDTYAALGKPQCTAERIVEPQRSLATTMLGNVSIR